MARTVFRTTGFSLRHLVDNIDRGDVALPELQRPFVWSNSKVRDLFDSMYRGFPVGYLLFWETGAEVGARQIGVDGKDARVARWLIVDGQQRLTSLYSVLTGHRVVREDYTESRVRLAFRPRDAHFAVADAAIAKNPEFLPDVSELWRNYRSAVSGYFDRLESARGDLESLDRNALEDAFDRVRDLQNYLFNVVELDSEVAEEQVAEVFVRINSEGVTLNQADFILTLLSVFWEKGRRQLEDFARGCKVPSLTTASPFNWYIGPRPDQMLRVSIALAFRRAVLKHAYSVLRGKDLEAGDTSNERRDEQFARLQGAQEKVLDLTNWHEFIRCLERAGFRGSKMISSQNAILYTYAVWLVGRVDYGVPIDQLREVTARWFFMAHMTSRYSGSFETQVEKDFATIVETAGETSAGFVAALNHIVDDTLTGDYWTITLPNELSTSAARSPALFAYIAALNVLDADALLGTGKIRERLDPATTARKGIDRHHLFPKAYLRNVLGIIDNRQINQIANMAFVEWNDNIAISDRAPADYWPQQLASKPYLGGDRLQEQIEAHALPQDWTGMAFPDFLQQRRRLMANVVRTAFTLLSKPSYDPYYSVADPAQAPPAPVSDQPSLGHVRIVDLHESGLLRTGTVLTPTWDDFDAVAEIDEQGQIVYAEQSYDTPSAAAVAVTGAAADGWTFWQADTPAGQRRLDALRHDYRSLDITQT